MIIILGLVILLAAVIVGLAGIFSNSGSGHVLTHGFAVFGYHVTGSTGTLFLYGIVLGAIGVLGLVLLLAGARRTSRRGRAARRGLKQSRRETASASQARDALIDERDTASAHATDQPAGHPLRTPPLIRRRPRNRPRSAAGPEHVTAGRAPSAESEHVAEVQVRLAARPSGLRNTQRSQHVYRIRNDYSHRCHCAGRAVHATALKFSQPG